MPLVYDKKYVTYTTSDDFNLGGKGGLKIKCRSYRKSGV